MKIRGFTLIEVLIVIAILGLLILVAAPLSGGWVRSANVLETEAQLTQAFGKAKAAALRNNRAATGDSPASAVCLTNNVLTVREGTSTAAPSCGATPTGTQLWQIQVSEHVTVKLGSATGANFSCLCLNNKGQPTTNACTGCATSINFHLSAGSETQNVALF